MPATCSNYSTADTRR